MNRFYFTYLLVFSSLTAFSQTLQSVTESGNYTTRNIWIGMQPDALAIENTLNIGGKVKLLGTANIYTTGIDGNQPTIYRSGTNTGTYPFNTYDNLLLQAGIQNRDIVFLTGATPAPKMVVKATGNVGVGTIAPEVKLDIHTVENVYGLKVGDTDNSNLRIAGTAGGPTRYGLLQTFNGTTATGSIILQRDGGNVGIGTSNPGSNKLTVEGTIGARKVKVTQGSWADFVFEPGYQLPSLQEVESYVALNKHLPDVPAAAEIEKEGLDLGEMQKLQMQKIEELMLYMIELKKENEALKARITDLENMANYDCQSKTK